MDLYDLVWHVPRARNEVFMDMLDVSGVGNSICQAAARECLLLCATLMILIWMPFVSLVSNKCFFPSTLHSSCSQV